jgi:fructose-bisphosphate aldolase class II
MQPNIKALAAYVRARFESVDVPVSIMLDHGSSVEHCRQVLDFGFTDVMYDGSSLPYEENIANTKLVVKAAHAMGAAVEAELGHVGSGADYDTYGAQAVGFTDPELVERFVEETGIDFLAIAFGNAHGLYKGVPKFNFDLIREIHGRVSIPLVMHGGTGTSDDQFHEAISAGISKINYVTNVLNTATENMIKASMAPGASIFSINLGISAAYRDWSRKLFQVFGTAGKG